MVADILRYISYISLEISEQMFFFYTDVSQKFKIPRYFFLLVSDELPKIIV